MLWLIGKMWIAALAFFLLGYWARWFFARPGSDVRTEDMSAELAAARTRHQECEADRARLKARAAEVAAKFDDTRRAAEASGARVKDLEAELARAKTGGSVGLASGVVGAAAGIDWKARNDETQRSLDAARARISDLEAAAPAVAGSGELEALRARIASLETEAKGAEEARKAQIAAEKDAREARARVASLEADVKRLSSLEAKVRSGEDEARELRARIATLQNEEQGLRARIGDLEANAAKAPAPAALLGGTAAAYEDDAAALRRRIRELEAALDTADDAPAPAPAPAGGTMPTFFAAATEGEPDDLKKIKGIGPKLEALLHSYGVYYYRQIGAWTDAQVAEVDSKLQFPGRIVRDKWVEQAQLLASGGQTEFAKRYDEGETPSSY